MGTIRRYSRHNGLRYLWTLTYRRAAADRAQVIADLRRWRKNPAVRSWGPMAAVIERGTQGTERLHVHLAVNRFIDRHDVQWYWHHGNVDVGDMGRMAGEQAPRELAGYLSKYVAKTFEEDDQAGDVGRELGGHRYLVAQGYQPQPVRREVHSGTAADRWLRRYVGAWDVERPFGTGPDDDVWGLWRGYPDACLWRQHVR